MSQGVTYSIKSYLFIWGCCKYNTNKLGKASLFVEHNSYTRQFKVLII